MVTTEDYEATLFGDKSIDGGKKTVFHEVVTEDISGPYLNH